VRLSGKGIPMSSSTSTAKKLNKQQRADQRKKTALKKKTQGRILWISIVLLVLAAVIYLIVQSQKPLPGKKVDVMSEKHHIATAETPHTAYNSDPPTSGPHLAQLAAWGVHKEEVPKELLVHNLEDGGVVIYYNKQADAQTVQSLEQIVGGYHEHVVLTPYSDMANTITLTAWGRILRLDSYDETQVKDFIQAFKGIDHH
jgi:hypothetical protein